ncbi:DHA2 family efflux MFS transporter permease subunit [Arthrobacter rhombi]|uniref:MDR family MFS transporter n=1 Tax=Arthrobacter rhombi TaxID=71253 RepID=UPI003F92AAB7
MTTLKTTKAKPVIGSKNHIMLLFAALMITMLMASLNQTVLSAALPTMVGELNGVEHMAWIITAFILASTIMMPVYGKLGDLFGRKPLLIVAILIFMSGSILGALSGTMNGVIIARVVQGLGGGGLMILSQATIADVIPARERGKYMGIMGGVFALSSVAGPLLGGWLTEGPGWRWAFWLNLPLGVLAVLATIFLLHVPRTLNDVRPKIDVVGMMMMGIATTTLVLACTWGGNTYAWDSPEILGLFGATVLFGVAFVLVERKVSEPVIPLMLFKNRNFVLTTFAALMVGIAMFGAIGYMPTYLQMVTGFGPTEAGLLMIPMMGALLVTSVVVGRQVSASGRYKKVMMAGTLLLGLGLGLLSSIHADTEVYMICVFLGVIGLGLGMSMQMLTLVAQNSFPLKFVGTATAGQNYFRQVGATLGSAVVGSLFASRLKDILADKLPAGASSGASTNSLTPELVTSLPAPIRDVIVSAYNEALVPLFLWMVPLAIAATIALFFMKEVTLATRIEREIPAAAVSEGQLAGADAPAPAEQREPVSVGAGGGGSEPSQVPSMAPVPATQVSEAAGSEAGQRPRGAHRATGQAE